MTQTLIAIDPGPTRSAYCEFMRVDPASIWVPTKFDTMENSLFLEWFSVHLMKAWFVAIEEPYNFGASGIPVFRTQLMVGRLVQEVMRRESIAVTLIHPSQKLSAVGVRKKTQLNQALRDIYGDGSKTGKGTKEFPSLLYGIKKHEWSALAVGHTWIQWDSGQWKSESDLDVQTLEPVVDAKDDEPRERWRKERDNKRRPKDKVEREAKPVESRQLADLLFEKAQLQRTYSTYCRICAQVPGECTCRDGFQPASAPTAPVPF